MRKHRFRESITSFFGSHVDPEKDEELRGTKQEIEDKVKRIRKLVNEDHGDEDGVSVENSRKESLAELIDDFYEHYQSLYAHYDHLTGELRKKVHYKQDKESSSSSSDSDSDNSSNHKGDKNGKMEGEFRKMIDELKLELEAAKSEVTYLKRELIATREEKEALDLEYQTASIRIKEMEAASRNMMLEAERLNVEKLELLAEKEKLNQDLDTAGKIEAEQSQRLENMDRERHNVLVEKESAMRRIEEGEKIMEDLKSTVDRLEAEKATLGQELETLKVEISDTKQQLVSAEQQFSNLSHNLKATEEENEILTLKVSDISKEIQQAQSSVQELLDESSQLKGKLGERDRELLTFKEMHEMHGNESSAQIKELEGEIQLARSSAQELLADSTQLKDKLGERDGELLTLKEIHEMHCDESSARIEELEGEIQLARSSAHELLADTTQLKDKLGERERELLTVKEMHEMHVNESSARIKELEAQVASQELEVESAQLQIKDKELQIESKATEVQQLREENIRVQSQISDIEMMAKHREDEISALIKRLEDNENDSVSRTENLTAQINSLLADRDSLCAHKTELEARILCESDDASTQIKGLVDQVNMLKQELESLNSQKAELELQLQKKNKEITEQLIQVENMTELILGMTNDQHRLQQEKEGLTEQINRLQQEVNSLCSQKSELEEHIKTSILENTHLREEKVGLEGKNLQSEETLKERVAELAALQEKHMNGENEASAQIISLTTQVSNLRQELDLMQKQKTEMESLIEREKQESSETLTQLENQKTDLMSQITDKQRMLEEQEEASEKLTDEYKQVDCWFQECKMNMEVAEKRMEAMAEEFRRKIEPKNQKVAELEEIIEELKSDVEVKCDELNTLVNYVRTLEVKLRLSNQKLRVTEQLLAEKEESFRDNEAKFLEERKILEERITSLAQSLAATSEAYDRMITDVSKKVNNTMAGVDIVIHKLEEDFGNCRSCMVAVSKELQSAKHWVRETNNGREQLKTEISGMYIELKDKKEQESMLRERVGELEMKARKLKEEKEILIKTVQQLEMKVEMLQKITKEKDEGILGLGEEKREAIRQLCLWIDYHRSRNDQLIEVLSKMPVRGQRRT